MEHYAQKEKGRGNCFGRECSRSTAETAAEQLQKLLLKKRNAAAEKKLKLKRQLQRNRRRRPGQERQLPLRPQTRRPRLRRLRLRRPQRAGKKQKTRKQQLPRRQLSKLPLRRLLRLPWKQQFLQKLLLQLPLRRLLRLPQKHLPKLPSRPPSKWSKKLLLPNFPSPGGASLSSARSAIRLSRQAVWEMSCMRFPRR